MGFFLSIEHTIEIHKKTIRDKKHEYEKSKTTVLELVEDLCDGKKRENLLDNYDFHG
jgi:hypothetical protein